MRVPLKDYHFLPLGNHTGTKRSCNVAEQVRSSREVKLKRSWKNGNEHEETARIQYKILEEVPIMQRKAIWR